MEEGLQAKASIITHEIFLVLRFLSMGVAVLLSVSIFTYLKFIVLEGPIKGCAPAEEGRRLPGAEEDEFDNSVAYLARSRELDRPGYLAKRLPIGMPFRRLMFAETKQCALCLEKPEDSETIIQYHCSY